jgi:hypothetical protein
MTQPIERYVEAIDHARTRARDLTEADAREVAFGLGMTPDELAEADRAAADALTRGRAYLDAGMVPEALHELRLATGVRPWDDDAQLALAASLLASPEPGHAEEADRLATHVLARSPTSRAAIEIRRQVRQRSPTTRSPGAALWVGLAALMASAGAALGLWAISEPAAPPAATTPVAPTAAQAPAPVPASAENLPVQLVTPSGEAWTYTAHQAQTFWHIDAQGSVQASMNTYGLLLNQAPRGVRKLPVRLEALDAQGAVLFSADTTLHDGSMLRPGDVARVGASAIAKLPAPPSAAPVALRLIAHDVDAGAPGAPPPTTVVFDAALPDGGHVTVKARPVDRGMFHARWPLEVINTGDASLASLTFDVTFEDAKGASLGTSDVAVAGVLWPALEPGDVRRVDAWLSFPRGTAERITLRPRR